MRRCLHLLAAALLLLAAPAGAGEIAALFQKMPYVNLLLPEPTERFINLTHQRYAERLGPDLGQHFVATFTDEPSLMSCYLKPMPWGPLPWASNLPAEFKRRRGYALDASVVPALIGNAGARGARNRYDFWWTVGELVSENFFGRIQDRCRRWNIPSGGHLLMEEGLVAHVPFYGDFFRCARRLDARSIDCLTSVPAVVPWWIARFAAGPADLEEAVQQASSVEAAVLAACPVERDDRNIRETLTPAVVNGGKLFDKLRRNYPERRDFAGWRVPENLPANRAVTLRALGFH